MKRFIIFGSIGQFRKDAPNNLNYTEAPDNADCAFFVYENYEAWMQIIEALALHYRIDLDREIISVYFEWSGGIFQRLN